MAIRFIAVVGILVGISSSAGSAAQADMRKAIEAATNCGLVIGAAETHLKTVVSAQSPQAISPREWSSSECQLALLIADREKAKTLSSLLATMVTDLDQFGAEIDKFASARRSPNANIPAGVISEGAEVAFKRLITSGKALYAHKEDELMKLERKHLGELAKEEKRRKIKSVLFHHLTIRLALHEIKIAQQQKDFIAFARQIPIIESSLGALVVDVTGTDREFVDEFLQEYITAMLALVTAAKQVGADWATANVEALQSAIFDASVRIKVSDTSINVDHVIMKQLKAAKASR